MLNSASTVASDGRNLVVNNNTAAQVISPSPALDEFYSSYRDVCLSELQRDENRADNTTLDNKGVDFLNTITAPEAKQSMEALSSPNCAMATSNEQLQKLAPLAVTHLPQAECNLVSGLSLFLQMSNQQANTNAKLAKLIQDYAIMMEQKVQAEKMMMDALNQKLLEEQASKEAVNCELTEKQERKRALEDMANALEAKRKEAEDATRKINEEIKEIERKANEEMKEMKRKENEAKQKAEAEIQSIQKKAEEEVQQIRTQLNAEKKLTESKLAKMKVQNEQMKAEAEKMEAANQKLQLALIESRIGIKHYPTLPSVNPSRLGSPHPEQKQGESPEEHDKRKLKKFLPREFYTAVEGLLAYKRSFGLEVDALVLKLLLSSFQSDNCSQSVSAVAQSLTSIAQSPSSSSSASSACASSAGSDSYTVEAHKALIESTAYKSMLSKIEVPKLTSEKAAKIATVVYQTYKNNNFLRAVNAYSYVQTCEEKARALQELVIKAKSEEVEKTVSAIPS